MTDQAIAETQPVDPSMYHEFMREFHSSFNCAPDVYAQALKNKHFCTICNLAAFGARYPEIAAVLPDMECDEIVEDTSRDFGIRVLWHKGQEDALIVSSLLSYEATTLPEYFARFANHEVDQYSRGVDPLVGRFNEVANDADTPDWMRVQAVRGLKLVMNS